MKGKALSVILTILCLGIFSSLGAGAEESGVACIGDVVYSSLENAVADIPADGNPVTVTLLSDATGNGVVIKEGQNVIIDLNSFTYTADGTQVGSLGTENISFQLLKGATVTLKNGVITSTKTKLLVQNYSDLTLEDVVLDGTKSEKNLYTLSNNFGSVKVLGDTKILGDENTVAFDLWYGMFSIYDEGINVVFDKDFSGEVKGKIEYGAHPRVTEDGWQEKASLIIEGGNFDVEFVTTSGDISQANITVKGGKFTSPLNEAFCAKGYELCTYSDGTYGVCDHMSKRVYESKEKTCLENGYDKIKCTKCEYTFTIDYISAGHSFTVYVSDSNATLTEDGTKTAICDNDGCEETNTVTDIGSMLSLGTPTDLSSSQTPSSITLSWSEVDGADGYRVFIYNKGWIVLEDTKLLSYTASGLKAGTKYFFAVRAYIENEDEIIMAPSFVRYNTFTRPAPPISITGVRNAQSIKLTWNKCTGATGYRVYIKTSSGWKTLKTTTALSYTATGLDKNTKYTFAVKPYIKFDSNYIWASKYTSYSVSTTYLDVPVLRVASTASGRATLAWSNIEDELGYQVYYSTNATSGFKKISNYAANTSKIYKTGFDSGETYYFKVRAYSKVNGKYVYSDYSDVMSLKIK